MQYTHSLYPKQPFSPFWGIFIVFYTPYPPHLSFARFVSPVGVGPCEVLVQTTFFYSILPLVEAQSKMFVLVHPCSVPIHYYLLLQRMYGVQVTLFQQSPVTMCYSSVTRPVQPGTERFSSTIIYQPHTSSCATYDTHDTRCSRQYQIMAS